MERSHAADVTLARRCAAGDDEAWQRFVLEYRPILYRAADALDPRGGARELADSLYADLYGLKSGGAERQSLFRYFQGRSSLATWLRAVLAQRYVDRLRSERRLEPLPDDSEPRIDVATVRPVGHTDPERPRYLALMRTMLGRAVAALGDRDRLRLACYYLQELTLAETGRVLDEHEATVSRHVARSRQVIRRGVEQLLRDEGLGDEQIAACFKSVADDPGPLDLSQLFAGSPRAGDDEDVDAGDYRKEERRKRTAPERSV